jgi:hypothetical protein
VRIPLGAHQAQVIHHDPERRVSAHDFLDMVEIRVVDQDHQRNSRALELRPDPVELSIDQRLAKNRRVERKPHPEHSRLRFPPGNPVASAGRLGIEPAHDGEPIGMRARRREWLDRCDRPPTTVER